MVTISILSRYRGTTKYHASLYFPNLLHVKMLSLDLSSLSNFMNIRKRKKPISSNIT